MEEKFIQYGPFLEEWREVIGFDGYKISSYGRIISFRKWKSGMNDCFSKYSEGKVLRQDVRKRTDGFRPTYAQVTLFNENGRKRFYVHRLLGLNFLENPENKKEINHLDGDTLHNHVTNIEWATRSENAIHAVYKLNRLLGLKKCNVKNILTNERYDSVRSAYENSDKKYGYTHFAAMVRGRNTNYTNFMKYD